MMAAILPPFVVNVRVREPESRGFHIWLPLFLLWPLLLIIGGFVLAVSVLVDFGLLISGARYHHYTLLLLRCIQLLAEVRGTHAHIRSSDSSVVDVDIY